MTHFYYLSATHRLDLKTVSEPAVGLDGGGESKQEHLCKQQLLPLSHSIIQDSYRNVIIIGPLLYIPIAKSFPYMLYFNSSIHLKDHPRIKFSHSCFKMLKYQGAMWILCRTASTVRTRIPRLLLGNHMTECFLHLQSLLDYESLMPLGRATCVIKLF